MRSRAVALGAGLLAGAVAGCTLAFVHADRIALRGLVIPFGVPLAAVTLLLAQVWLAQVWQRRSAALGVGFGWLAATAVMASPNASGDVPLPATTRAMVYLGAAAMALTIGVLLPVRHRAGHHRAQPDLAG
jgi:hypothetical protein